LAKPFLLFSVLIRPWPGGWDAGSENLEMLFSQQGHPHHPSIQGAMSDFVLAILFAPKFEEGLD
jgi:hypothetical protein